MRLSGVVLAGGSSRRMGTPKALLTLDGATFVSRALSALARADERFVMAGPRPDPALRRMHARIVPDPGEGPLRALLEAARAARHPTLLVAPCDVPRLPREAYDILLRAEGAAVALVDSHADPLIAAYPRAALARAAKDALASGRRDARAVLDPLDARAVPMGTMTPLLRDVDSPEDLEGLTRPRASRVP